MLLYKDSRNFFEKNLLLFFITIIITCFSIWLLQENGPWDFFVFIFLAFPINLVLLIVLLYKFLKIKKVK